MSDVPVGSVAGLELDGYRVRVQLDLEDDVEVPRGTRAVIRRTSLLGANFVELVVPGGVDRQAAPSLEDEDEITETASQIELEELRTEEHTSEIQSLMRMSYAVFYLKKNKKKRTK